MTGWNGASGPQKIELRGIAVSEGGSGESGWVAGK